MRESYWIINYDAERALHNFRFISGHAGRQARIYVSTNCAAIVISDQSLEAIREPHVMAWRASFHEISHEEFVIRATQVMNGKREHMGAAFAPMLAG